MAKRLSFQQIQILKTLERKPCYASEFRKLYVGCNVYRSLYLLMRKNLIARSGNIYHITKTGRIVLALFT